MKNIINQRLKEEIFLKKERTERHPECYDKRKSLVGEEIRSLGDVHSFWIENPKLRKDLLLEKLQHKTLIKMGRKGIQNIHNGWYYLSKIGYPNNFIKELNSGIIKKLNELILPEGDNPGEYRKKIVTLGYKDYTPPAPQKVPEKIKKTISRIKEIYNNIDPITSAITAHLEIAGIQPFLDGNKRVARLIQDRILYDFELPPAMIPAGEANFYYELLGEALSAYDEGNKDGQKRFYNYCTSKINNGLDEILGDLF
jgi:Fic family protein